MRRWQTRNSVVFPSWKSDCLWLILKIVCLGIVKHICEHHRAFAPMNSRTSSKCKNALFLVFEKKSSKKQEARTSFHLDEGARLRVSADAHTWAFASLKSEVRVNTRASASYPFLSLVVRWLSRLRCVFHICGVLGVFSVFGLRCLFGSFCLLTFILCQTLVISASITMPQSLMPSLKAKLFTQKPILPSICSTSTIMDIQVICFLCLLHSWRAGKFLTQGLKHPPRMGIHIDILSVRMWIMWRRICCYISFGKPSLMRKKAPMLRFLGRGEKGQKNETPTSCGFTILLLLKSHPDFTMISNSSIASFQSQGIGTSWSLRGQVMRRNAFVWFLIPLFTCDHWKIDSSIPSNFKQALVTCLKSLFLSLHQFIMNPLKQDRSRGHLYFGDCIEVMQKFSPESVDMILTDPPYIARYQDRKGRTLHGNFSFDWIEPSVKQMARVLKTHGVMISFYGWLHVEKFMSAWKDAGLQPVGHLVFPKSYASKTGYLRYQHDCAYVLVHKNAEVKPNFIMSDVRDWKHSGNVLHPTQKPVKPLIRLIECFTQQDDIILDPFMGSGSSLVAARACKRRSVGIEIDPTYFQTAKRRLMYRGVKKKQGSSEAQRQVSGKSRSEAPHKARSSVVTQRPKSTHKTSKSLAQNA